MVVQCFILSSLLFALGQKQVTYFSLDVEAYELDILKTIPFDQFRIDVISVEYRVLGPGTGVPRPQDLDKSVEVLRAIREFFKELGNYEEVSILPWGTHFNKEKQEKKGLDVIFKRTGFSL